MDEQDGDSDSYHQQLTIDQSKNRRAIRPVGGLSAEGGDQRIN